MVVHEYKPGTVSAARARHRRAAIIRPVPGGVLVFDNIQDARGHPTTKVEA